MSKRIALGADHAGFELKQVVADWLRKEGYELSDYGTDSTEPCDYPDFAQAVGEALAAKKADLGIVVCGSGVGASVAVNKVPGARGALCHDTFSARQGREDDDTNVLCMGARVIGPSLALEVLKAFVNAEFSKADRHVRRLNKVMAIEKKYMNNPVRG
ncbi:MAG TPA: ribose 5-phosphate isomerase B [Candidatus Obscuribacterales bacterium]